MATPLSLSEVPDATPYVQYVATSGQTVFPYPFPITQDSDLVVVVNGGTLATDSGYSLSGQGDDTGGNLTFTSGRSAGDIVTLYRDIAIERLTQIAQNGGFSSSAFNAEYNNIYLILQQLEASIAQCLQIPNTNNPAPTTALTPGAYANKYLAFDANGNPTPAQLTSSGSLTAGVLGDLLYPQSTAETSAGVTPTNLQYRWGNILRYGADPTGASDSTTAINDALVSNGAVYAPAGTYKVASQITLNSYNEWTGDGVTTVINLTNASTSQNYIQGSGISYARVRNIKFSCSGGQWTPSNYYGVVAFISNSQYCEVSDCWFTGYSTQGVLLSSSSNCQVRRNIFTAYAGSDSGDGADIHGNVEDDYNLAYNVIEGNQCFGGGNYGIALEVSATPNTFMWKNLIANNRVGGENTTYGILLYTHQTGDSYNQVIGNYVENVSGSNAAQGGSAGAGIYCAQQGGALVANNTVVNCCTATSNATLAPGGIGFVLANPIALQSVSITGTAGQFSCTAATLQVGNQVVISGTLGGTGSITGYASPTTYKIGTTNGSTTFTLVTLAGAAIVTTSGTPTGLTYSVGGLSPVTISGNIILDMAQGNTTGTTIAGIFLSTGATGASVTGNTVTQQQNGGLIAGIYVGGTCNNVTVTGNCINILPYLAAGTRGIYFFANGSIYNVTVSGNLVEGCASHGISFEFTSAYTTQNVSVNGNTLTGGGSSCVPLYMSNVGYAAVSGNNCQATTDVALYASAVTHSTFEGNIFYSTGTNAVQTNGTCTGSYFGKSNLLTGDVDNAGMGFHVEQTGSASPAAGTWATGDILWNISGSGADHWTCSAGGTSGTWEPSATPVAALTGWGTPTNAAVENNFAGTSATLAQCGGALAELIIQLKAAGVLGA